MTRNTTAILAVAALAGLVGPRLTAPHDRAAGAPFAYATPDGFAEMPTPPAGTEKTWVLRDPGAAYTPNINLTHSDKVGRVEDEDLRDLARGLPAVFSASGITWSELRHETRAGAGGAHVGLIEGAAKSGGVSYRMMELVFPDDRGTSIVTASFPVDGAARFEAELEASIAASTGVARRLPPPPGWMYAAWAAAGAVLAYLALALGARAKGGAAASAPDAGAP